MRRAVYRVEGLESRECRRRLREAVRTVDGVDRVELDGVAVDVTYDETDATGGTIAARIAEAGFEVLG